jgi:parallel beta-helix repeat protein
MTGGSHLRWRVLRVRRGLTSITVSLLLVLALFAGLDLSFDIIPNVSSGLIEVDDSGGKDHLTIQEGIDAAIPGDTVFVYAGTYDEDVTITKTINLTGEDRDTTIINSTDKMGIYVTNADFVNISGFTVVNGSWAGIRLMPSNNSLISNNRVEMNDYGIEIVNSNNTIVKNNIASNNSNYHGIYISYSTNSTIDNNICLGNKGAGIYIADYSINNIVTNNNCSNAQYGIWVRLWSDYNTILNNNIFSNSIYGVSIYDSDGITLINNTFLNNYRGIYSRWYSYNNQIYNNSILNSTLFDIGVSWDSHLTVKNTTFNKSKTYLDTTDSTIKVEWYLHVNVIDYHGNPVPNVNLRIEDNINSSYNETFLTDSNGYLRWLTVTEYFEQDTTGDTIGERTYHTPHQIIAWNDTLVGYANPIINESKNITIIINNGTLMNLKPGWNLISLPRIQSDTNLQTILQSIDGRYNSVQWYNISDNDDHWKHHHILKPSNLNDLVMINHTMGIWIYITDPLGTNFVIFGDDLSANQNISLLPGWNLVGFPSKTNKTRDVALNTILYGTDVDAIWTFNATNKIWVELNEVTDYFEVNQGYWIHSKVTKVWNVPI